MDVRPSVELGVRCLRTAHHGTGAPSLAARCARLTRAAPDVFHLQAGTVEETRRALSAYDATVFTRQAALDRNLFGDRPVTDLFRRRCGDLLVTHRELGVWFGDVEPAELSLVGMHGGCNPAEMLVPFAAARLSTLA